MSGWKYVAFATCVCVILFFALVGVQSVAGGLIRHFSKREAESEPHRHFEVIVVPGDTLSGIAERELGKSSRWVEIATLNKIEDPCRLAVGTVLKLPR